MIWLQKAFNFPQTDTYAFWGFGDMLRGTAMMFLACKELNIKMEVDLTHHPVSCCIDSIKLVDNTDNIPFYILSNINDAKNFLLKNCTDNVPFLFSTNGDNSIWPLVKKNKDCKNYIKKIILSFNNQTLDIFKSNKINEPYIVYHTRLGDSELVLNQAEQHKYDEIYNNIIKLNNYHNERILFMSDSGRLNEFIRLKCQSNNKVIVSRSTPVHLGLISENKNIISTLLDYYLLFNSIKIFSENMSGFSFSASVFFDIPYIL